MTINAARQLHQKQLALAARLLILIASAFSGMQTSAETVIGGDSEHLEKSTAEELAGVEIGSVSIATRNIFDLNNPKEDKTLYRLANRLHVKTRPNVIYQQLLFAQGDLLSAQALEESERILRRHSYIQDAQIEAVRDADGLAAITVTTTDVWTLLPKASFSRKGGESRTSLGVKDSNFLGTGILVEAVHRSDVDRDSNVLKYVDRNVGDTWYGIKAIYEDSSDGQQYLFDFGKPFYSLESKRSHGITTNDYDRVDSFYDRGQIASQYRHHSKNYGISAGWSQGLQNGWAKRFITGLRIDEQTFSEPTDSEFPTIVLPADRRLVYPFIGLEFIQDAFEETRNVDQIARTEDRFLGSAFSAELGFAGEKFGSDRDAMMLRAGASLSLVRSKNNSILFSSLFSSRWETGGAKNALLSLDAKYYRRQSEKRLFFVRIGGDFGHELDLENTPVLGGDSGLRGYPLRYQSGNMRALLTIEQRFFTDWYPLRLFRVGAAVFFDAGRTWGEGPLGNGSDGLLKDVGVGLRFGNTRSGLGRMVHMDLAYPLDGDNSISNVQFLVGLKAGF